VFVEPYRLVELNNQVIMAQQQIQMEIARILSELSQLVKADLGALELLSARVAWADTLHARCRYAMRHRCTRPLVSEDGSLRLLQARHPLLRERAVPITMELDPPSRPWSSAVRTPGERPSPSRRWDCSSSCTSSST
jgi:DNA mismatch repair protein MutS2